MKQRTYKCDGGYVRVRIGKRNFIYYHNGVAKGDCQIFKFDSKDEFDEYCKELNVYYGYPKQVADFYNAEVVDYDDCCDSNLNVLFKLTGMYCIYANNDYDCDPEYYGDVYFVKCS